MDKVLRLIRRTTLHSVAGGSCFDRCSVKEGCLTIGRPGLGEVDELKWGFTVTVPWAGLDSQCFLWSGRRTGTGRLERSRLDPQPLLDHTHTHTR